MSPDLAEGHQVGGRGWLIRTRPVELLIRRHGDCIELESRIRRARRELGSARSYGLQQALVEIEADLGTYAGLLAERETHLGWEGPLPLPRVAAAPGTTASHSARRSPNSSTGRAATWRRRSGWGTRRAPACWPRSREWRRRGSGIWRPFRAPSGWLDNPMQRSSDEDDPTVRCYHGAVPGERPAPVLAAVAPNNDELQRSLTFNPIYLTDGIQLSDDPFVALRSAVYALSVAHRH